tara:strand:+ start:482 stop:1216 length:735 start_codon:yes stop_codon:yes gene_type:complete
MVVDIYIFIISVIIIVPYYIFLDYGLINSTPMGLLLASTTQLIGKFLYNLSDFKKNKENIKSKDVLIGDELPTYLKNIPWPFIYIYRKDKLSIKLKNSKITNNNCCKLDNFNFVGKLNGSTFENVYFENLSMRNVVFSTIDKPSIFKGCCFINCDLSGSRFDGAKFDGQRISENDVGKHFKSSSLKKVSFVNATFRNADFRLSRNLTSKQICEMKDFMDSGCFYDQNIAAGLINVIPTDSDSSI